jgi:hypothetical protein
MAISPNPRYNFDGGFSTTRGIEMASRGAGRQRKNPAKNRRSSLFYITNGIWMKMIFGIIFAFLLVIAFMYRPLRLPERAAASIEVPGRVTDRIPLKVPTTGFSGPAIDVADLVINWRTYQNKTIAIEGTFRCNNEDYCAFARSPGLRTSVTVDISMLSVPTRRHLILDCSAGCNVVVFGNVDDGDIFALNVSDVPAKQP